LISHSYNLEKIADEERDAALGNGGLGRLVSSAAGGASGGEAFEKSVDLAEASSSSSSCLHPC